MNATEPPSAGSLGRDLVWCGGLAAVALILGVAINSVRAQPLPLVYQSKAERLQAQLSGLKSAPARQGEVRFLTLDDLAEQQARGPVVVLDARPEVFHRMGHIPGALPLPREEFAAWFEKHRSRLEANKSQLLAIYCQGEDCEDSHLVAWALAQLGYSNLRILPGGWSEWQARHQP